MDLKCSVDDCPKPIGRFGIRYCFPHQSMYQRHKTPTPVLVCIGCKEFYQYKPRSGRGTRNQLCFECYSLITELGHLANKQCRIHGITRTQFLNLLKDQSFRCKICKEKSNRFYIDHDHKCCNFGSNKSCGKCIRGLLCPSCNTGIAFYEKHKHELHKFDEYLSGPRLFT